MVARRDDAHRFGHDPNGLSAAPGHDTLRDANVLVRLGFPFVPAVAFLAQAVQQCIGGLLQVAVQHDALALRLDAVDGFDPCGRAVEPELGRIAVQVGGRPYLVRFAFRFGRVGRTDANRLA